MSQITLPGNCHIEYLGDGEDDLDFRLCFESDHSCENYYSEIYSPLNGETVEEAAYAVCVKFNWINEPPNKD